MTKTVVFLGKSQRAGGAAMRMVEAGTSRRRMNITSKPQSEMPMQICMRMQLQLLCGCRVEADVLPTLQGTKYPDDFSAYIVYRWYNDAKTLVLFTGQGLF